MFWRAYERPNGYLDPSPECHALFYYADKAASNWKDEREHIRMIVDGKGDQTVFNYFQLWKTTAELYGADPDRMKNYWSAINMQRRALGLTVLPDEPKYRDPGRRHAAIRPARPN